MADIEAIKLKYPAYAFLLDDNEIAYLLAVATDQGMDPQTFQAHLMNTNWWKTHSQAQRDWYALSNTDPANAQAQKEAWKTRVNQMAGQYGVKLTAFNLEDWANTFLSQGIQPDDPRVVNSLVTLYYGDPTFRSGDSGNIETITDQAKQLADQYMIDLTPADYTYWASRIAKGEYTMDGLRDELKQLAMDRYEAYAPRIAAGVTPQQIFSQHRNAIAQELEIAPERVDLMHDPRFSKVLGVPTTDGKVRPMTYSETITLARQQDEWKTTTNARTQGADLTAQLLKTFGRVA